jgi:TPR repeat protein
MARIHKIFPHLAALLLLAATPAWAAHSGAELAAIFDKGVAAYDAGEYEKAFKIWWDIRYEDLAAMRNLGMMLRKGQGTPKDPEKAQEVYMRAAVAGLPTAQADLADMYLKGELGPPDMRKIVPLLEAAAAANHPVAQYQLGQFYETGAPPFVPQDLETARQLYASAASHGMKEAAARAAFLGPPAAKPVTTDAAPATSPAPAQAAQTQVAQPQAALPAVPTAPPAPASDPAH